MTGTENSEHQSAGQGTGPDVQAPDTGMGGLAQSIGARNLWIIILTMPAVFLVAVAAIIAIFGKPKTEEDVISGAAPDGAIEEVLPASGPSATGGSVGDFIGIEPGAAAGAIALDGDRLAVRVDGPGGGVVVIYDIAKGEEIARIPFRESPAREQ